MKLVLLPGMDGTGVLFNRLAPVIEFTCQIIALPLGANQSYAFLTTYISSQLPAEEFILLAESFSGPIAAGIAGLNNPNLKALIFIATFLTPPLPELLFCARFLPLRALVKLPLALFFIQRFLLGHQYPIGEFILVLASVGQTELSARLSALKRLKADETTSDCQLPTMYLAAQKDCLVAPKHLNLFKEHFPNLTTFVVPGTHFLVQSNPVACAEKINTFVKSVIGNLQVAQAQLP
ncbi:MAG TPA: hypothetical protein VIZ65_11100 [Cellvibrionaceae bacterium]